MATQIQNPVCFVAQMPNNMTMSKRSSAVSAEIFEKAGFGAGKDATGVSVLLGFFKLLMTGAQVSLRP
jgi:hypothetical protein